MSKIATVCIVDKSIVLKGEDLSPLESVLAFVDIVYRRGLPKTIIRG